jgi:hypothetical protein
MLRSTNFLLLIAISASFGSTGHTSRITKDCIARRKSGLRGGSDIERCLSQKTGILSKDDTAEDAMRFMDAYTANVYQKMRDDEVKKTVLAIPASCHHICLFVC